MAQITAPSTSTRRLRRWTIGAAALVSLLVTASGAAASQDLRSADARAGVTVQDLRSPDARAGVTVQDLRSPDARVTAAVAAQATTQDLRSPDAADPAQGVSQAPAPDLRSPDARQAGQFTSLPAEPEQASGGFEWGYLALGVVASLMLAATFLLVQHRRHRPMPLGG
jgi:hypothetical protein